MSAWLQWQALALPERRRRRSAGRGATTEASATDDATRALATRSQRAAERAAAPRGSEPAVAALLAEFARLRRDLQRLGVLALLAFLLLALPYGWPALRWLLLS
jgi:hypothetical protein